MEIALLSLTCFTITSAPGFFASVDAVARWGFKDPIFNLAFFGWPPLVVLSVVGWMYFA